MDLGDTPNEEGKTTSCVHAAAHYQDPYWYEESGRHPLAARQLFQLPAGDARMRRLRDIVLPCTNMNAMEPQCMRSLLKRIVPT